MTTKPRPSYYFDGITFNSGYYTIIDEAPLTVPYCQYRSSTGSFCFDF